MKISGLRERFVRDEGGFTLTEILVTIIIMTIVLFSLYSIFDMTLKVFSFGNNKVEAVESARVGMEKMEREMRQAYKFNSASSQDHLFFTTATPTNAATLPGGSPQVVTQLTFGNDLGGPGAGNGTIECGSPCEYITYKLTDNAGNNGCTTAAAAPCTLRRVNTANSADLGAPVVENVAPNGLTFTLFKSDGTNPANESEVGMVLVELDVVVDEGIGNAGSQTLTTVIDLRNR